MLTDMNFRDNGVREYTTATTTWTMIVQGRVGFLLDEKLAAEWRVGGANIEMVGMNQSKETRSAVINLGGSGGERGIKKKENGRILGGKEPLERRRHWHICGKLHTNVKR